METGHVRWETKVSPDAAQYFFHGDPLVANDIIVTGADRATGASVHAVDARTGKELWKHPSGRGVSGPVAGASGRAYAASAEGQLISFVVASGALQWSIPLKLPAFEGPAAAGDGVFAGTTDGSLYSVNADTGREQWRVGLGAPVTTSVLVSGNDVYVGTEDGSLHRVDASAGTVVRSRKLDPNLIPRSVPVRTGNSVLVLLTDRGAEFRALVSIDPALDRVRWHVAPEKPWTTTRVFVWGDVVVLGTSSGDLSAYCTDTGTVGWSRAVKGYVRSIGGGKNVLFVGTRTGDLYALHAPRSCDGR